MRAANEEASIQVWNEVIERYPEMRQWVAHNKTVPLPILEVLSMSSDKDVRYAVAMKRKLSPLIFDRLARDPDESVRAAIAANRKAPIDLLSLLAHDQSPMVSSIARSRISP
ncbi:hypothetical protein ACN9MY_07500 [Pseudoduganella sp. R-31]|uniref:hypothetical protein n=1 Tax=Pseudoduganella sp. R-31 TaxID=3404060 RepID=UPI003CFB6395